MSTATALTRAYARRGSGPKSAQTANAAPATATTAGTKTAATRSARRWIGARLRCASATRRRICASTVSAPVRVARMRKAPLWLSVAPVTGSPAALATGSGSPVSIDSSTLPAPSTTAPSVGTRSPGRTRSTSPGTTAPTGMSRSSPPRTTRAVAGARSISSRTASPVRFRARSSSTCPISTSVVITAADSK